MSSVSGAGCSRSSRCSGSPAVRPAPPSRPHSPSVHVCSAWDLLLAEDGYGLRFVEVNGLPSGMKIAAERNLRFEIKRRPRWPLVLRGVGGSEQGAFRRLLSEQQRPA